MTMVNHEKAMKIWNTLFGKSTEQARDYKGREIRKAAYGQENSAFGWNLHHKKAKGQGGADTIENLEIVHVKTHVEFNGRR